MKIHPDIIQDNYSLYDETRLFLMLCFFYNNNIITRKMFLGQLKQLKSGKLDRRINTFHCRIDNEWYNDESIVNIYYEIFSENRKTLQAIEFEDLIKYIQLYINKPRNYCIDWFNSTIINELFSFDSYNYYWPKNMQIDSLGIENIPKLYTFEQCFDDSRYELGSFYCCEDCDGDYREYCESRYKYGYFADTKDYILQKIKDYLESKKKKYLYKNEN